MENIDNIAPAPVKRPEWIDETPDQTEEYSLSMMVGCDFMQDVELTRDEFITLKAYLAKMRGFEVKPEEKAA